MIQCDNVEDDEFVIELSQSEFGEGQSEVSQNDSVEEGQSVDEESQGAVSDASDMASCLRAEAAKNLRKEAKRMVSRSVAKLKTIEVGDNVLIPVSEFDRGRGDPANLIGIVLEKGDSGFRVGTKAGILAGRFSRNQIALTKFKGISSKMIPDNDITVRSAVRALSVGHGQGYRRCNCTSSCLTKRCSCLKNGFLCNSACHPRRACKNC